MFCLPQSPFHTMFEVKERNLNVVNQFCSSGKSSFRVTLFILRQSPWIQKDFLSCTDLPLTSAEGFDIKPCNCPPGPAHVPTTHGLEPMSTWVLSGHATSPCWPKLPLKVCFAFVKGSLLCEDDNFHWNYTEDCTCWTFITLPNGGEKKKQILKLSGKNDTRKGKGFTSFNTSVECHSYPHQIT